MSRLVVHLLNKDNRDLPAIDVAAMYVLKAKALQHDTIRVEKMNGALVNEFPVSTVERFIGYRRLAVQPGRQLRRDRGDYEFRKPLYPGLPKETD